MITKSVIDSFFRNKRIAVIGASAKKEKYGNMLIKELLRNGYDAVPVNIKGGVIEGRDAVKTIRDVNPKADAAIAVVPPSELEKVVEDASFAGIKTIWIHEHVMKGVSNPKAIALADSKGMTVITGCCPLMFVPGAMFLHRIHGFILKMLGGYPK